MKKYHIRRVRPGDNKDLATIIRGVFEEHDAPREGTVYSDETTDYLYEYFQVPNAALFVGEVDGEVVGCGGVYPTKGLPEGCLEFVKFYIRSAARGIGLGKAILTASLKFATDEGFSQVYIESIPHYRKAIAMYEKVGFRSLTSPLGESGHPTCDIWMLWEAETR